jgi:hypothetical protein
MKILLIEKQFKPGIKGLLGLGPFTEVLCVFNFILQS